MAETRRIVITIRHGKGKRPTPSNPKPTPSPKAKKAKRVVEDKGTSIGTSVLANQVYENVKAMLKQTAEYEIDKYFDTRNDYVAKRNLSEALTYINMASSIATATYVGFQTGGPVGAAIGAGLVLSHQALNASLALERQRIAIERNDAQLAFSRDRAGFSLTAGSRGENL